MATRALDPTATSLRLSLGLSLALALGGQLLLLNQDNPPIFGLVIYAAAAVIFVLALRRVEVAAQSFSIGDQPAIARAGRLPLWVTTFAFSAMTVQGVLGDASPPALGRLLVAFWLLSILLYVISVLQVSGWTAKLDVRAWWQAHWRVVLIAAGFGLAAFVVRVYDLQLHPYAFINDEGEVGKEALAILNGQRTNFFDVGWASQPVWAFVPAAISVKLFGNTAFAVRLVSVMQGSLTVSLLYLLGRELFDPAVGVLAATVLIALPLHVHFSRLGVNNVGDAFFSTLLIWLTYRAVRRGSPAAFLVAGLATGAALYTYLGSRLAIALVFGSLAYIVLRRPEFLRRQGRSLVLFAGAALVVALPMAAFFMKTPDQFYARLNTEGILGNGFLQRQAAATGQSYWGVLLDQFSRSTLVYVARPAIAQFFNSPQPYLMSLGAIFFVLGLAYAVWRLEDPRYMTLFAWFWTVVILGSTLTVGPPSSQRLLMTAPPLALMVALGLQKTASLAAHGGLTVPRIGLALAGIVAVVIAAQGLAYYFGPYRTGHYFEDPSNEFSYEVGVKSESLGPTYRVFLLGAPSVYSDFADFGYLAPNIEIIDYNTVTPDTFAALPRDRTP